MSFESKPNDNKSENSIAAKNYYHLSDVLEESETIGGEMEGDDIIGSYKEKKKGTYRQRKLKSGKSRDNNNSQQTTSKLYVFPDKN